MREKFSNYKVKGTGFINLRKFVTHKSEESVFHEEMQRLDPEYSHSFLASTWYSAYIFKEASEVFASHLDINLEKFCLEMNAFNLKEDLNGVYRFFLQLGGIQYILRSSPRLIETYTNSMKYVILENEYGFHKAEIKSPTFFIDWNQYMYHGGSLGFLEVLGKDLKGFQVSSGSSFEQNEIKWETRILEIEYD